MHILVLTDRDWTHPQGGGTGTNLYAQVSRWLQWGHRVSIIACGYPGAEPRLELDRLTLCRVGGRSTVFPRAIWGQWRGLVPDPDVVLEVINGVTFLTPLWLRTPRVALIHHIHREHYVREMGRKGAVAAFLLEHLPLRLLYRQAPFLTVSEDSARDIQAQGIPAGHIEVNHNGMEVGAFGPGERADEPTLLYLGRLKRYKRIEVLLDALEAVPEAVLDIAGEGDHRPELEAEIAARGLSERVRLHGFVDEARKRELLRRAWVHVTASSAEGWCLSVMEAAACATPTVALAAGGLRESVVHGETGLLADTPEELAEATRRLLRDDELRGRLGRAALERAKTFSWERTAERTLAALEREREVAPARPSLLSSLARTDAGRAGGLALAMIVMNVVALIFTIVFARLLGSEDYGSLSALVSAFLILSVPGSALQVAVARDVSRAAAAGDPDPTAGVWRWLRRLGVVTAVAAVVGLLARDLLATIIAVPDDPWAAASTLPTACLWLLACVLRGALQGLARYGVVGFSLVGEAFGRLIVGLGLYAAGLGVTGAFLSTAGTLLLVTTVLVAVLARAVGLHHRPDGRQLRHLIAASGAPLVALALIAVLQNIDVIAVKHAFDDDDAGSYAAAAVAAKAIFWVSMGVGMYLLPEASRRVTVGLDARPILVRSLIIVLAGGIPMIAVYAVGAEILLRGVFGAEYTDGSGALPILGAALTLLACTYLAVQYLLALRQVRFLAVLALAAVVEPALIVVLGSTLIAVALVLLALNAAVAAIMLRLASRRPPVLVAPVLTRDEPAPAVAEPADVTRAG